ncbi:MAG TPA: response regulator FixJ [Alphaproteobacteria bacterium]|jgi:two-component system response regulator FixJ|nr:response regulator FixJ [Alphaproteobacteria bacterium]
MATDQTIFIVDDDEAVRDSLAALLFSYGYTAVTFPSALHFLARADRAAAGCLIADVRMPDMDGLELQEKAAVDFPHVSVVIITGHGDVPVAVRAMKAGAVDFVEKPFSEETILEAVKHALAHTAKSRRQPDDGGEAAHRLDQLTPREREVLEGLVAGLPNKTIAYDLGISARTVEIHRAHVMDKMQVRSLSALVRLALAAGIEPSI